MPIRVVCPECDSKINAPDTAVGKRVKCPKCQNPLLIPNAIADEEAEPTPQPRSKVVLSEKKKSVVDIDEDDENDQPRPKRKVAADDEEHERPKKKSTKKKGKGKKGKKTEKKSFSAPQIIGTVVAALLALGAIGFLAVKYSRSKDTAVAKSEQRKDIDEPRTESGPTTKPSATIPGAKPTTPTTRPTSPLPNPEITDKWGTLNAPIGRFTMRVQPAVKTEYTDVQILIEDGDKTAGVIESVATSLKATSIGPFDILIFTKILKPGLSEQERESIMLSTAKSNREAKPKLKVTGEFEIEWCGRKGRGETFEGDGENGYAYSGYRRYCHTESAVYYLEMSGISRLVDRWLGPIASSVDSIRPTAAATPTPSPDLKPFTEIGTLAVNGSSTRIAAYGNVSIEPDGKRGRALASLRVWDLEKETPITASEFKHVELNLSGPMAFSPDDKTLAVKTARAILFFEAATGKLLSKCVYAATNLTLPDHMAFTTDGKACVLALDEGMATVQASDGSYTVKKPKDCPDSHSRYHPATNRIVHVRRAKTSEVEIAAWNPASDAEPTIVKLAGARGSPFSYALTDNGKTVAVCIIVGSNKAEVTFYDTATGKLTGKITADEAPNYRWYSSLALSPDGKYLAGIGTGDSDQIAKRFDSVVMYRVADGKRLYRATSGPDRAEDRHFANALTFSPDSKSFYFVQDVNKLIAVVTETGMTR